MSIYLKTKIWLSTFKRTNDKKNKVPKQSFLFLDESGQLSLKDNKNYYILSGILTTNIFSLNKAHNKISKIYRFKSKIEYKASKMRTDQRMSFLEELSKMKNVKLVALVFDKKKWQNFNDKNAVNNFFIKHLIKYLKAAKIYSLTKVSKINIIIDQRTSYIGKYYSLKKYLTPLFENQKLSVFQADSATQKGLQFADILSNTLFRFYNNGENAEIILKIQRNKKLYISMYPIPNHCIKKYKKISKNI